MLTPNLTLSTNQIGHMHSTTATTTTTTTTSSGHSLVYDVKLSQLSGADSQRFQNESAQAQVYTSVTQGLKKIERKESLLAKDLLAAFPLFDERHSIPAGENHLRVIYFTFWFKCSIWF